MGDQYFVEKTTGTFADELLAAGFVLLLEQLHYQQGQTEVRITQVDRGSHYEISTSATLDRQQLLDDTNPFPLAPILRTVKNRDKLPDLPDNPYFIVDYEVERDKSNAFFTAYKELGGTLKRAYAIGDDDSFPFDTMPPPPHTHMNIFMMLNAPPMPINNYNKLMLRWLELGEAGEAGTASVLLLDLFGRLPNDVNTAAKQVWKPLQEAYPEKKWSESETASQFMNPAQGKGVNKAQPDSIGLSNLSNFWLLEWLMRVGFFHIAMTSRVKGTDDRKTYVPAVGRADLQMNRRVHELFRSRMRFGETAVRSDIFTIIRYLKALIERVEAAQRESPTDTESTLLALLGDVHRPPDFMRGFHMVFYKSLGTAPATMNISFLNLPGWVRIDRPEDTADFQQILEEHERIVERLAENKGEELTLLQLYRDFIVADNLDPFFEFTTAYSSWLISQGEKRSGFPPRKFTVPTLRRLLVSVEPELSKILDSPGFINIAYAIRQSTIVAQYRKKEGDRRYDVRYGLGRDLVRRSQYPEEFVAALSDFLHQYNAENAQVMETRSGPYRKSVQTGDIQNILDLIDRHGSDLIAKLLVAYGYARDPRIQEADPEEEPAEEIEETA